MADVRSAVSSALRTPRCTVLDAVQRTGSGAESGGAARPTLRGVILGVSVIGSREPSQERLIDLRRECPVEYRKTLEPGVLGRLTLAPASDKVLSAANRGRFNRIQFPDRSRLETIVLPIAPVNWRPAPTLLRRCAGNAAFFCVAHPFALCA